MREENSQARSLPGALQIPGQIKEVTQLAGRFPAIRARGELLHAVRVLPLCLSVFEGKT